MSTKMIARGIVGSLRLAGATTAVAVGLVGFSAVGVTSASAAPKAPAPVVQQFKLTDQQGAQLSQLVGKLTLPKITLKAKTCKQMADANVPTDVLIKLGCIVIPEAGEIIGGAIFS
jgi:hypothetical protein